jgi:hypothetical protein
MLAREQRTAGADTYLEVDLNKVQCRVRSYALGGMPYLEQVRPLASPSTRALVEDVISGRLTPAVSEMFDGIELPDGRELPCFVTDRRQSIAVESSVTLVQAQAAEPVFRVHHARSPSDGALCDDTGLV